MKLHTLILFTLALCFSSLTALADQRIATINLRIVFDGYYKTKAADATLKDRAAEFDKEKKVLVEDYKKLTDEYKKAVEDANNQAISADERERRKSTAEAKLIEVREMEQTINQFDRQALASLDEQERRIRQKLLEEIQVIIDSKAKAGNYTLVLDVAAETRNRTPFVLYSTSQDDLTDAVLVDLNASAPPGLGSDSK